MSYAFCDTCSRRRKEFPSNEGWGYDEDGHTYCPVCIAYKYDSVHHELCRCVKCIRKIRENRTMLGRLWDICQSVFTRMEKA